MDSMYDHMNAASDIYQQVLYWWSGGQTKRFHTIPAIQPPTVATHSYNVAWLCYLLERKEPSVGLLIAALAHDTPECIWGDIPAPSKWAMDDAARVSLERCEETTLRHNYASVDLALAERRTLKLADYTAGMLEATQERGLGNKFMRRPYSRWKAAIAANFALNEHEREIIVSIDKLWRQANGDH